MLILWLGLDESDLERPRGVEVGGVIVGGIIIMVGRVVLMRGRE